MISVKIAKINTVTADKSWSLCHQDGSRSWQSLCKLNYFAMIPYDV